MEEIKTELQEIEKMVSPVLVKAEKYAIATIEDVEDASGFLRKIKDMEQVVEDKRTSFTKPLNESLKNINDTFKKMREPLEQARRIVSDKILGWKRIENDRIAAEQAAIRKRQEAEAEERRKNDIQEVIKAPEIVAPIENKIGNIQTVKRWTFDIVDFAAVPDSFKVINQIEVNSAIRTGTREVPGLKIYQIETLAILK